VECKFKGKKKDRVNALKKSKNKEKALRLEQMNEDHPSSRGKRRFSGC
jgi:hypothetical protein